MKLHMFWRFVLRGGKSHGSLRGWSVMPDCSSCRPTCLFSRVCTQLEEPIKAKDERSSIFGIMQLESIIQDQKSLCLFDLILMTSIIRRPCVCLFNNKRRWQQTTLTSASILYIYICFSFLFFCNLISAFLIDGKGWLWDLVAIEEKAATYLYHIYIM